MSGSGSLPAAFTGSAQSRTFNNPPQKRRRLPPLEPGAFNKRPVAEQNIYIRNLTPFGRALLYLLRWKIEKAYDVYKNKQHQQKAWANGSVATQTQAHLTALTHNLLTIMLCALESAGLRVAPLSATSVRVPVIHIPDTDGPR